MSALLGNLPHLPGRSARALLVGVLVALSPLRGQSTSPADDELARERARGWAPPTPEDTALFRTLGHRLDALHLNALALRRLHAADLVDQIDQHALLVRRPGRGNITHPVSDGAQSDRQALNPGLGIRRLPRFVDNSALPHFPPLFDQGRLESCTAVVTTYYQLTHTIGLMRGWDQALLSPRHRFSPAWTYNLTNNGANSGVSLLRAYAALSAHGAATLAEFPYRGSPTPAANYRRWPDDAALWRRALENRIDRFGLVDARDPVRFFREIRRLLLNGHVLTASTAIDGWDRRAVAAPPGSPAPARHLGESVCTRVAPDSPVNHAVTIVGYDDDLWVDLDGDGRVGPGEQGAFKIANSWGRGDWNRGYRWLHYGAVARVAPARPTDTGWRGAFWLDRVYWMVPHRYYQPARILEIDVAPVLREDLRLSVGAGPGPAADVAAVFDRVEVPNLAFAQAGGPYGFTGSPKPDPRPLPINLDLTPALLATDARRHSLFLRFTHPAGPQALRSVKLRDPLTGALQPLDFGPTDASGTRWSPAPPVPHGDAVPAVRGLPVSLALRPGQPAGLRFTVTPGPGQDGSRPVRVVAFSTRASTLAENQIVLTPEADNTFHLELRPRPDARGSSLVLVHATDGWRRSTTSLRINLEDETNTAPTLSAGTPRREGDYHVVPLTLADAESSAEKLTVFFDTPQIEVVTDFEFVGTGARRELRLRIEPGARADLAISAFDGELIGEATLALRADS